MYLCFFNVLLCGNPLLKFVWKAKESSVWGFEAEGGERREKHEKEGLVIIRIGRENEAKGKVSWVDSLTGKMTYESVLGRGRGWEGKGIEEKLLVCLVVQRGR